MLFRDYNNLLSREMYESVCVNAHLRSLPLWWLWPPSELLTVFVCELHQSCVYNRFSLLSASLSIWVLAKYATLVATKMGLESQPDSGGSWRCPH